MSTHTGYAGGHLPHPTYRQVCGKQSGHAEVVRVTFDTRQLSLEDLLRYFFRLHDPTIDRSGKGGQYRSAIFFEGTQPEMKARACLLKEETEGSGSKIHTEIGDEVSFYPAGSRHQQYCRSKNITPRVPKGLSQSLGNGQE